MVFVDRNNIQIDGTTEDVMPLEDLRGKFESFGWHVQEIDGHNMESIIESASMARSITNRPSIIIAHTIPGKGVDFMEYDYYWHGAPPNHEQAKGAQKTSHSRRQNKGGRIDFYAVKYHLRSDIYSDDPKQEPTRAGFGRGLKLAGQKNDQVVALCADLTESTQMHHFKEAFPNRYIEIGVAEQTW